MPTKKAQNLKRGKEVLKTDFRCVCVWGGTALLKTPDFKK